MKNMVLKSMQHLVASLLLAASAMAAHAEAVSVAASADTTISVHPSLGSGVFPLGSAGTLWAIAPGGFQSYPLIQFDLSGYAGRSATSDASLQLTYQTYCCGTSIQYSVWANANPWSEATTTWYNYSTAGANYLSSNTIDISGWSAGHIASFLIPEATVQGWIDSGATNFGIMLRADTGRDQYWASREYTPAGGSQGDWAPRLSFDLAPANVAQVPEPETYTLMLAGLGLMVVAARRRKRQL